MPVLLDTSILGRLADHAGPAHGVAQAAIAKLLGQGESLRITAQNLIEFRNFATRPVGANGNGLGLSVVEAAQFMTDFEFFFPLLEETADIYPAWRAIVDGLGIIGKTVHDARLVAVCHVHGVSQVLTFNVNHFTTLSKFGPGLMILDPRTI